MGTFIAVALAFLYTKLAVLNGFIVGGLILSVVALFFLIVFSAVNETFNNPTVVKYRKTALKCALWLVFLVIAVPSQDNLKIMAIAGGAAWAIQDEDVQTIAKDTADSVVSMAKGVASAAIGSGETLSLVNQVLQRKLKEELK